MISSLKSTISQADSDHLIGQLSQLGLPANKANYLLLLTHPDLPEFPLDAELVAQLPEGLPGKLPTSIEEMASGAWDVTPEESMEMHVPLRQESPDEFREE
jgi:hypothetical protein